MLFGTGSIAGSRCDPVSSLTTVQNDWRRADSADDAVTGGRRTGSATSRHRWDGWRPVTPRARAPATTSGSSRTPSRWRPRPIMVGSRAPGYLAAPALPDDLRRHRRCRRRDRRADTGAGVGHALGAHREHAGLSGRRLDLVRLLLRRDPRRSVPVVPPVAQPRPGVRNRLRVLVRLALRRRRLVAAHTRLTSGRGFPTPSVSPAARCARS